MSTRSVTSHRINHKLLEHLEHPGAERVFKEIKKCSDRGWFDPPVRYLAARIRRSVRQTHRALQKLEAAGYLRHRKRWRSRNRCATSVYEIVGCIHVIGVIEVLKPINTLKAPPSERRLHSNHPPAMAKIFLYNERLMAENRGLRAIVRSHRDERRSRADEKRARQEAWACIGMYTGPQPEPGWQERAIAENQARQERLNGQRCDGKRVAAW